MTSPGAENVCPNCRTARRVGAEFCPRCGHAFEVGPPPATSRADDRGLAPVEMPSLHRPSRKRWLTNPLLLGFAIFAFMAAVAAMAVRDWRVPLVILGVGALVAISGLLWELID